MKSLKYFKLNIEHYKSNSPFYLHFDTFTIENKSLSNLETLIIGYSGYSTSTIVSFETLTQKLFPRLPKLKNLLIDFLEFETWCMELPRVLPTTTDVSSNVALSLQYVKIEVEGDETDPNDAVLGVGIIFISHPHPNKSLSNLETLIIGYSGYPTSTIVSFETLTQKLFPRLPKLKNLLIDFLEFESWCMDLPRVLPTTTDVSSNVPLSLQYVKIEVEGDEKDPNDSTSIDNL
ncbi:unnamed protein product [Adineta steineri]|uniref:Uncharacterized protein n=1 Tax=Adineta steineri TaxID=433720 RepID=A0A813WKT0_9BILA|nr:unnamed protein product [Adineta steineri]